MYIFIHIFTANYRIKTMESQHQEMATRLEENHQWLIENSFNLWDHQIRIWWEIFNILKKRDKYKLEFLWKDENSIFNIQQ